MRHRHTAATIALAAALAALAQGAGLARVHAAGTSPEDRLAESQRRAALAHADLSALLASYRDAALAADGAAARSFVARLRAELSRALANETQSAFDDRVRRVYIQGPAIGLEALLGSRTLGDLEARLPFAERSIAIARQDVHAVTSRRAELTGTLAAAEDAQRALAEHERRLAMIRDEITRRLSEAEAGVRAARADLAVAARERLRRLSQAFRSTLRAVDLAVFRRRHARAEADFAAAAPFLGPRPDCTAPKGLRSTGESLRGEASWYGPGFAGKATATGATFDPKRYTVAHKTLPFGVFLLIHNDGKCVVSFLNDRGPYVGERILDLSAASAQAVDLSGVEHVEAEIFVRS